MVDSDGLSAGVAVLGEDGVETVEAVRSRVAHDVPLAAEHSIAFEAREVAHMPRSALRFGAFVRQNQL